MVMDASPPRFNGMQSGNGGTSIGTGQGGTPIHYGLLTTPHIHGWPHAAHLTFEQRSLAVQERSYATLEQILQAAKETNVILGTLVAQRTEEAATTKGKKK